MQDDDTQRARGIDERVLADLNDALFERDFARFRPSFELPYEVFLFEGYNRCDTEADLRNMFDRASGYYATHGATDLIRIVHEVAFTAPNRLKCLYESRVIVGRNTLFEDPFFCLNQMVLSDGAWRITRSEYDILPSDVRRGVLLGRKLVGGTT